MDCCLVGMPFLDPRRPSLGLGLVQAALEADGLTSCSIYGNVLFGVYGGPPAMRLMQITSRNLIGDWVFARAAFPEFASDQQAFFDQFSRRGRSLSYRTSRIIPEVAFEEHFEMALQLRAKVDGFLNDLVDRILVLEPRAVGCSSILEQHVASLALLRRIRERAPGIVTVMGGSNCESVMGVATHRNFPWVDFVVSGEADHIIGPLMRSIRARGRDVPVEELPAGVFGPAHRDAGYPSGPGGRPPRAVVEDISPLPAPNYDDYFRTIESMPELKEVVRSPLPVESSRGCWWYAKGGCTFCGGVGQRTAYRSKDPHRLISQIRHLVQRYGVQQFMMTDSILDLTYIESLLPLLKADDVTRDCRFFYETKSNLQPHQVKSLREAGVIWIQPGIESLNTNLLRLMNKGCEAWQNIRLLKSCLRYGVRPYWNVLHGFPLEQDTWYAEMAGLMRLLHHLPQPMYFQPLRIERFSAYQSDPERFNLRLAPLRAYSFVYPLERSELEQLAYWFDDETEAEYALNPMFALLSGDGLDAARSAFCEWKDCWTPGEDRPSLTVVETPESLLVRDTRKVAVAVQHELRGLRKEILAAADSGPLRESLVARLVGEGNDAAEVEDAMKELVDLRLAIDIDRRFLSLAVPEPLYPLPDSRDYRGGTLMLDESAVERQRVISRRASSLLPDRYPARAE